MTRILKVLSLALMAVLTVGVLAASTAGAEEFAFAAEAESATVIGAQTETHSLTVDAGTATCETVTYVGSMGSEVESEIALIPALSGCVGDPLGSVEVDPNSCRIVLSSLTKEGSSFSVDTAIECEGGDSIEITVEILGMDTCFVDIGPQSGLGTLTLSEQGSPTEILADTELSGIEYDQTAGSGLGACANAANTTNGTYQGKATLAGFSEEAQVDLELYFLGSMKMFPDPVPFTGIGNKQNVTVTNTGTRELDELIWSVPFGFIKSDKCKNESLEPEGKAKDFCVETIECQMAATGEVNAGAKPGAAASSKLTGCKK